jgi:hypothetical protein
VDSPDEVARHETTDRKAASRSDESAVHAVPMTQEEFIAAVSREAFESATKATVLRPKGQKPHAVLVALWDWFAALTIDNREFAGQATCVTSVWSSIGRRPHVRSPRPEPLLPAVTSTVREPHR